MEKKNAHPAEAEVSAQDSANATATPRFTPRQSRVREHLEGMEPHEWLPRESVDRIAGASNGPQVIRELRQKLGYDAIEMQRVEATDRDGRGCKPGRYRLTLTGRERLRALLTDA